MKLIMLLGSKQIILGIIILALVSSINADQQNNTVSNKKGSSPLSSVKTQDQLRASLLRGAKRLQKAIIKLKENYAKLSDEEFAKTFAGKRAR
jgi:hypothetical protein